MTRSLQSNEPALHALLAALGQERALTPSELVRECRLERAALETHLKALEKAGVIRARWQGPHRYFEATDKLAATKSTKSESAPRVQTGPRDPAMRRARVCYGHLGGDFAVRMFDRLSERDLIAVDDGVVRLTVGGKDFAEALGIDCSLAGKACLDWSNRRSHLAGPLGNAFLKKFYELEWAERDPDSRLVTFSRRGEAEFDALFG
jgi:DNA-binding transcriptional ArsR family regulator